MKGLTEAVRGNPNITLSSLAKQADRKPEEIVNWLGLFRCIPPVLTALREGRLSVNNAYALSKLPAERQVALLDDAINQSINSFLKGVKDADQ